MGGRLCNPRTVVGPRRKDLIVLGAAVLEQLRGHFARLEHEVELVVSDDATSSSLELVALVEEVCSTSEKLSWRTNGSS